MTRPEAGPKLRRIFEEFALRRTLAALLAATALPALAQTPPPPPPAAAKVDPEAKARDASKPADAQAGTGAAPTAAAKVDKPKWDVNAPPGLIVRQVKIDTDEGSWIDLDVSPDGHTIAFSLLGDIYTMPITGGTPTRIAEGLAWEVQPRWSPDGRRIAFTSDRGGGDNIWLMNADGRDKRQLTREDFRLLNQPSWSKDGRFIAAKKHFTTQRSLGTGEIWLYHVSGGGGVQLVKRASERLQKELGEPVYSADGRAVFYTRNVTPGPIFEYAQDGNKDLFNIERYDLETGEVSTAVSGLGGSVRPTPSPEGKRIAFVRRERERSKLYVRDLASGEDRKLYDDLDQDVQETWAVTGVYPNMSWTPDGRSIVFWAGGKIRRVNTDGSGAAVIPFRISDTRGVIDPPHPQIDVTPAQFETRMTRWAAVSPDGTSVVFESLGRLYVKPIAGGQARRLTRGDAPSRELWPSWSRDGRQIVFVDWTDAGLGQIKIVAATGGAARTVTARPGHYAWPRFSPDGRTIAFESRDSEGLTSPRYSSDAGVYRVAASGGAPVRVAKDLVSPQWGTSSERLFMIDPRAEGKAALVSTDLNGEAKRTHARGELTTDFTVSPRGDLVAFRQNYEAWVMPLLPGAQAVDVSRDAKSLPVTRLSTGGANWLHWTNGGDQLHWSLGPTVYTARAADLFAAAPGPDGKTKIDVRATAAALERTVPAARPTATVAIMNAKLVTMARPDGGVIEDGTILIRGDRIDAVGPAASVQVPAGAIRVDARGKTIIPGLIDAHAHGPQGEDELVPQQNWSLIQNLAYGTTTIHDPSSRAAEIYAASEMQRAGLLLGPRIFSTAEIIYGAKAPGIYAEIESLDDALAEVRRIKAQGGHSIKNYNQPRRDQRQMLTEAARRENMQSVVEGGSLFGLDMTHIADGNSTLEHNIPLSVFYNDVVQYFSQSRTNYTPTLVVTFGGLGGDPYWRSHMDVWREPLMRHSPPAQLAANNVRRGLAPEEDYADTASAREARKLAQLGVQVSIGAHGQQAGLGPHWEMWSFAKGGMSPIEALAAGTIVPARSLGMAKDVGSLEPGKLADLVILDADPTADIRNSAKVSRVMIGGRLYDASTMNEVATGSARRLPYWWEGSGGSGSGGVATRSYGDHED
jgi:imidazolonepropionase-like amidohydrolase/Tol biopolymer transport system component